MHLSSRSFSFILWFLLQTVSSLEGRFFLSFHSFTIFPFFGISSLCWFFGNQSFSSFCWLKTWASVGFQNLTPISMKKRDWVADDLEIDDSHAIGCFPSFPSVDDPHECKIWYTKDHRFYRWMTQRTAGLERNHLPAGFTPLESHAFVLKLTVTIVGVFHLDRLSFLFQSTA